MLPKSEFEDAGYDCDIPEAEDQFRDQQVAYCVSIPGESDWVFKISFWFYFWQT
jgi:hypothetical protein